MQKIEVMLALILSIYVTHFAGLSAALTMFSGWLFATAFSMLRDAIKDKDCKK